MHTLALQAKSNPTTNHLTALHNVMSKGIALQAKLTIGKPNDKYEQEADRVADKVVSMPEPATRSTVQKKCTSCESEDKQVQQRPLAASITPSVQKQAEEKEEPMAKPIQKQEADKEELKPKLQLAPEEEEKASPKLQLQEDKEELAPKLIQKQEAEEEDRASPKLQLQEDKEELAAKLIQKQEGEEEKLDAKPIQKQEAEEEKPTQLKPNLHLTTRNSQLEGNPQPEDNSQLGPSLESRLNSSKSSGNPLSKDTRSFMESRIGSDFSKVKVHTGSNAVQMSKNLNAQAFAHGNHIYFNQGKYNPTSSSGKHLLAHELTHTVQQGGQVVRQKGKTTKYVDLGSRTQNLINRKGIGQVPGVAAFAQDVFDSLSVIGSKLAEKAAYEALKKRWPEVLKAHKEAIKKKKGVTVFFLFQRTKHHAPSMSTVTSRFVSMTILTGYWTKKEFKTDILLPGPVGNNSWMTSRSIYYSPFDYLPNKLE